MKPSRKRFLYFQEAVTLGGAAQAGVFGGIFGGKEWVTSTWGQMLFFPAATFFSILQFGLSLKKFIDTKNKNLGKTASILLAGASLIAEVFAVTAAVLAYCGTAILAAGVVPIIFVSMIGTNCAWNLLQAGYHGIKYATCAKGSHTQKAHGKAAVNHLWGAAVLGAIGTAITFLMVSPIALGVGAVIAVKSVSISFLALNVGKIFHTYREMRKQRKIESSIEMKEVPAVKTSEEKAYEANQLVIKAKRVVELVVIPTEKAVKYKQWLEQDNLDDLITKLHKESNPEEFIVSLLNQSSFALKEDKDSGQNCFKRFFNDETPKRNDKLKMVQWMKELVQKEVVTLDDGSYLGNFDDLENHMKEKGMERNVFSSFFVSSVSGGRVEKLFNLVKHYMANKNEILANLKVEPEKRRAWSLVS